ncbi:TadE/TadG family type IV pilus assembly protein [Neorhizobium sp. JUb45]|uniref:vWA domain-containing protein n=1 Tax=unclassified Neorhizobium TaxID=2629175 RepID=UPI00104920EA|nr:TadE/TadG family type IV pilus assembly protein [Neorhizobium sp. JUb45]TCR06388.1 Flp pilus assembly protein TadG [Neorhizobium sp. JUb45]
MGISRHLAQLIRDRGGNFGIITASIIPVLVGVAGISIDVTRAMQVKAEMQGIADSAVLAAATSLSNKKDFTEAQAKDLANTFYATQIVQVSRSGKETETELAAMVKAIKDATTTTIVTKANGAKGKIYDVSIASSYTMPVNQMTAIVTGPSITLGTKAASQSATESQNAFSMYLVLDQSGSMKYNTNTKECIKTNNAGKCTKEEYVKKIDALKGAVKGLLKVIAEADPNQMYARLGAVSYNEKMQDPEPMSWGTAAVGEYAADLPADGSTNSGEATALAYATLAATGKGSENDAHNKKNGQVPSKFIVLMTDGENNVGNADVVTKTACNLAKAKNITVYSVAFMAPPPGQTLLNYCASTSAHYFNAESSAELAAAFKSIGEAAAKGITRLTQ